MAVLIFTGSVWAQPLPHQISGIIVASNQTVTLSLEGSVSNLIALPSSISSVFMKMFDLYPVDASTDLSRWARLSISLRTNNDPNPLLFQETNDSRVTARFYRTPTNYFITGFPKPTGPFAVGTTVRVLSDASRTNRYGIPTNSSFMSTIWYPADLSGPSQLPESYTDAAVATDPNWFHFWSWLVQWTNVQARCVTHTFRDLPLATGTNRFPVILHSHGWTMDRTFNSEDAAELASHGYIVAAVDHEDCHATVFPDARGARYQVLPPPIDSTILIPNRVKDLEILLNELGHLDQDDALLAGRLDLNRVGVMGLSYGGGTAAEVARTDERVKCAALLEPAIWSDSYPGLFSQGVEKPVVLINTPLWTHTDLSPSPSDFRSMSQTLYNLATTNATWFYISGVGHVGGLSDVAWTVEQTPASRPGAFAINASLVWFFDTYLKGESPSFPTNSPITNLLRK